MRNHEIYLICKAWTERKSWNNFKALWTLFDPWVNPFYRICYIVRNTVTKEYARKCHLYEARMRGGK